MLIFHRKVQQMTIKSACSKSRKFPMFAEPSIFIHFSPDLSWLAYHFPMDSHGFSHGFFIFPWKYHSTCAVSGPLRWPAARICQAPDHSEGKLSRPGPGRLNKTAEVMGRPCSGQWESIVGIKYVYIYIHI